MTITVTCVANDFAAANAVVVFFLIVAFFLFSWCWGIKGDLR